MKIKPLKVRRENQSRKGTIRIILRRSNLCFYILIVLLTTGCASSINGACRHNAAYCGLVMGEHYPVRIVSGIINSGNRHAQAQAYIDGKWQWLEMEGHIVSVGEQEYPFLLDYYSYYDVQDYIKKLTKSNKRKYLSRKATKKGQNLSGLTSLR